MTKLLKTLYTPSQYTYMATFTFNQPDLIGQHKLAIDIRHGAY